jgi:hypothetical protein
MSIADDVAELVNQIDGYLEQVRILAALGSLIDDAGPDYFRHSVILLTLIAEHIVRIETLMSTLTQRLREL